MVDAPAGARIPRGIRTTDGVNGVIAREESHLKTLLVLRHAKSSWADAGQDDHDRPLNGRGKRDASRMGRLLAEEQLVPDLIVTSSAKRARKTARRVAKGCDCVDRVREAESLYLAAPDAYVRLLSEVGDDVARLLVVGHNPGISLWASSLTGEPHELPTAALVAIHLAIDRWGELALDSRGKLVQIWLPRELED